MVRKVYVFVRLLCTLTTLSLTIPFIHPVDSYAFTARNLVYGSQGYDVDELQSRLHLLGYYWGKVDGDFGWKTYWAVRTFQYNFGMKVTGDVDMATKMKLVKATPNWHYTPAKGSSSSAGSAGQGNPTPHQGSASSQGGSNSNSTQGSSNSNSTQGGSNSNSTQGSSNSNSTQFPSTTAGLDQHDLELMAHVVYGEARGEPFKGQVAIAAVILNRLHSSKFPNSIPGIVYSPGAFSAVSDGQVNLTPNAEAKKAVMDAVKGWDPSHGAVFYFNPAKTNNAFVWSRPEICKIGHHIFTK